MLWKRIRSGAIGCNNIGVQRNAGHTKLLGDLQRLPHLMQILLYVQGHKGQRNDRSSTGQPQSVLLQQLGDCRQITVM